MKRIATIAAVLTAAALAGPSVAAAGSVTAQVVKPALVKPALVKPALVKPGSERTRPTIQLATDSRGRSVWRSGRYLME